MEENSKAESAELSSPTQKLSPRKETHPHGLVKLNIGGRKFMTTKNTLLMSGSKGFFSSLLEGEFPSVQDEEGYYFIDRDGKYFEPLLEFLRTGELEIPPGISKRAVAREANFYSIEIPLMPYNLGSHSPPPSPRSDGVYMSLQEDYFFIVAVDNIGYASKYGDFKWFLSTPIIELTFASKDQITYSSGVIEKTKKMSLLWEEGSIYDTDGVKLDFYPSGCS